MNDVAEKLPTPDLSKRVLDDQKDGDRLAAMARQHAPGIATAVAAALGASHGPAVEALVRGLAARVTSLNEAMVSSDVALSVELADDAAPRAARDRHDKAVREAIVDVRERVVGMYGQATLSTYLLASAAPRDARQLVTYAERAAAAIEAVKPDALPESRIEGAKPSPKKWAALIRKPAGQLKDALGDVDREAAEAVTALTERNTRRDAFEAFNPRALDLLEGLLRFGGMNAEADRLARPVATASNDNRGAEEPADPPADDPTPA